MFTNNILLYFEHETFVPAPEKTDMILEKHPSHKGGKAVKRVKFTCHYLNLDTMEEIGKFVLPETKSNLILNNMTNASGTLGSVGFNDKCIYFFDSQQNFKRVNIDKLAGVIVSAKFWVDPLTAKEYYCFVPWTKYLLKVETSLLLPKKLENLSDVHLPENIFTITNEPSEKLLVHYLDHQEINKGTYFLNF